MMLKDESRMLLDDIEQSFMTGGYEVVDSPFGSKQCLTPMG